MNNLRHIILTVIAKFPLFLIAVILVDKIHQWVLFPEVYNISSTSSILHFHEGHFNTLCEIQGQSSIWL